MLPELKIKKKLSKIEKAISYFNKNSQKNIIIESEDDLLNNLFIDLEQQVKDVKIESDEFKSFLSNLGLEYRQTKGDNNWVHITTDSKLKNIAHHQIIIDEKIDNKNKIICILLMSIKKINQYIIFIDNKLNFKSFVKKIKINNMIIYHKLFSDLQVVIFFPTFLTKISI